MIRWKLSLRAKALVLIGLLSTLLTISGAHLVMNLGSSLTEERKTIREIESQGGRVVHDSLGNVTAVVLHNPNALLLYSVMSCFPGITGLEIHYGYELGLDPLVAQLSSLAQLRNLFLLDSPVTPSHLSEIVGNSNIKLLALRGKWVTDEHMLTLPPENLTQLSLSDTLLTNNAVRYLASMSKLQELTIARTPGIQDPDLQLWSKLPLRRLNILEVPIGDNSLTRLETSTELQELTISECAITDNALMRLPRFPQLRKLNIGGNSITDSGINQLSFLDLELLAIHETETTALAAATVAGKLGVKQMVISKESLPSEAEWTQAKLLAPSCEFIVVF